MRRKIVTHPGFQTHYTSSYIIGLSFAFLAILVPTAGTMLVLSQNSAFSASQKAILVNQATQLSWALFIIFIPCLLFTIVFDLYRSFKMIGPLRRIESWLELILIGQNPSYFKLRAGDELKTILELIQAIRVKWIKGKKR